MSVADVFVALTEDRPYRKGMQREDALRVIERMVRMSALDGSIAAQNQAAEEYRQFVRLGGELSDGSDDKRLT